MKRNLKKITDKTVQDLLQNEIILPSSYFESFDKNAKDLSIDITDTTFENEVSDVIVEELKNINIYMQKTIKNIDSLSQATKDAQEAIKNKDEGTLTTINSSLNIMKNEIDELKNLIYLDELTKVYNRKWIYNHMINEEGTFQDEGILLFIDINDFNYIIDKYGNLIADNVIIYVSKFLSHKFKKETIDFKISRYSNDQFILFINSDNLINIISFINNIRIELSNSTLKSKSGLTFKTNFNFGLLKYNTTDIFQSTLETAAELSNQDREKMNQK